MVPGDYPKSRPTANNAALRTLVLDLSRWQSNAKPLPECLAHRFSFSISGELSDVELL